MSVFGEVIVRFVETDMGITANPQKLQVDTAQIRNQTVVPAALRIRIRSHAIGNMDMVGSNIDVVEEVLMHEVVIALRIVCRQPPVLVQIHRGCLRKVQISFFVPENQLAVDPQR